MKAFVVFSVIALARAGILPISTDAGYAYGTHFSGINELGTHFGDSGNIHISTVGDFLSGHPRFTDHSALGIGSVLVNDGFTTGSTHFTGVTGIGTGGIHTSSVHRGPIVTKEFYIHSAPDELEEPIHKVIDLGPSRKNYRVVFIKAPGYNHGAARISVVQPQNEDKTVIYVLAKKPDASNIEADVQAGHSVSSKPEVFFIKYKTQEEALEAQRKIQAQYDALGGTSRVSDEGIAPVTSVIGSVGGIHHNLHTSVSGTHLDQGALVLDGGAQTLAIHKGDVGVTGQVAGDYLPPHKK